MESFKTSYRQDRKRKEKPILTGHNPATNEELFKKYIVPNFDLIKALTIRYTNNNSNPEEDFWYVVCEFYKYIYSYSEDKPLHTWLHIITKRVVQGLNKKRYEEFQHYIPTEITPYTSGAHKCTYCDRHFEDDIYMMLSGEIVSILREIKPKILSPFLLQLEGRSIKEIAEIEFARNHTNKYSEEVIKRRIFFCRNFLRTRLTPNGKIRKRVCTGN